MKLLETKKGIRWLGVLQYYLQRVAFYMYPPTLIMTAGTFWHTTFKEVPGSSLMLMNIAIGGYLFICIVMDKKYLTSSYFAYSNELSKENNPILQRLDKIENMIKEMRK